MLSIGDRMKSYYEDASRIYLTRRTPVIIRVDGKVFHSLTKRYGIEKPFDERFIACMSMTALHMCSNIQGVKLAYVQSDEISLLLTDYDGLETDAWFGYNLQKIVSVSASIATAIFNGELYNRILTHELAPQVYAHFDARAFNIPKEEVNNYFHWRQIDAIRNSILSLAQSHFSHAAIHKKSTKELREMLKEKGADWEGLVLWLQRGQCVIKKPYKVGSETRTGWDSDRNIPLFVENREYIEQYI